jgi:hypothetical protein
MLWKHTAKGHSIHERGITLNTNCAGTEQYRTLCTQTQAVRVWVITAVLSKIQTFHNGTFLRGTMSTCSGSVSLRGLFDPEDTDTNILRNLGNYDYLPTDSIVFMKIWIIKKIDSCCTLESDQPCGLVVRVSGYRVRLPTLPCAFFFE